ncbi:MAG: T9SS type A sorting domain-containing protein [Ignavibacteria bacterium]|nr:T9SS type A sorting domain-containing protein [Ignavibacteria bacterium]
MIKTILNGVFISLLLINSSNSQSYDLKLQNHQAGIFEFQFDIFFSNNIEYAKGQYAIKFPDNISADLIFSFVADCSELSFHQIPYLLEYDGVIKLLIIRPRNIPQPGQGTISPVGGDRVARIRIFSNSAIDYDQVTQMKWQNSGNDRTRIYAYINSSLTEITDSNNHTKDFNSPLGFSANYTPELLRPVDNSIVNYFHLWLVCFYPSYTISYRVQVSTDSLFINSVVDTLHDTGISLFNDSVLVQSLKPLTEYYWRLNVHNSYAISPFSRTWSFNTDNLTNVNSSNPDIPYKFSLNQNYPNPFNPSTIINYTIPYSVNRETSNVKLIIYNSSGKEVRVLVNENKSAGSYSVNWNASNFPSGIYYYTIKTGNYSDTKKMILLK